ncbi:hydrolase [Streptomyces diastaticus]
MDGLLADLPADLWTVPYVGARHPGSPATAARPVAARGANCQLYAYEVLRRFGRRVPPLRSAELWADRTATFPVPHPEPLDLLLFSPDGSAYGAHVGLWMAEDTILHLCREVGRPAVWSRADFAARARYRELVGIKRVRTAEREPGSPAPP